MPFPHWEYFLALEDDLEKTTRYVEFTEENFDVYSVEFARILLASASEVDVIAKIICNSVEPETKHGNIDEYRKTIRQHYERLAIAEVNLPRYGLTSKPWAAFSQDENPDWWRSHQKVKHKRDDHYEKANLKNTIDAVSGLFLLVLLHNSRANRHGLLVPPPKLVSSRSYIVPPNPSNMTPKQTAALLQQMERQKRGRSIDRGGAPLHMPGG